MGSPCQRSGIRPLKRMVGAMGRDREDLELLGPVKAVPNTLRNHDQLLLLQSHPLLRAVFLKNDRRRTREHHDQLITVRMPLPFAAARVMPHVDSPVPERCDFGEGLITFSGKRHRRRTVWQEAKA